MIFTMKKIIFSLLLVAACVIPHFLFAMDTPDDETKPSGLHLLSALPSEIALTVDDECSLKDTLSLMCTCKEMSQRYSKETLDKRWEKKRNKYAQNLLGTLKNIHNLEIEESVVFPVWQLREWTKENRRNDIEGDYSTKKSRMFKKLHCFPIQKEWFGIGGYNPQKSLKLLSPWDCIKFQRIMMSWRRPVYQTHAVKLYNQSEFIDLYNEDFKKIKKQINSSGNPNFCLKNLNTPSFHCITTSLQRANTHIILHPLHPGKYDKWPIRRLIKSVKDITVADEHSPSVLSIDVTSVEMENTIDIPHISTYPSNVEALGVRGMNLGSNIGPRIQLRGSIDRFPNLTSLTLIDCKLGNQGAKLIADLLPLKPQLDTLVLDNNGIDDEGAKILQKGLIMRKDKFTSLSLQEEKMTAYEASCFIHCLHENEIVTRLYLYPTPRDKISAQDLAVIEELKKKDISVSFESF